LESLALEIAEKYSERKFESENALRMKQEI